MHVHGSSAFTTNSKLVRGTYPSICSTYKLYKRHGHLHTVEFLSKNLMSKSRDGKLQVKELFCHLRIPSNYNNLSYFFFVEGEKLKISSSSAPPPSSNSPPVGDRTEAFFFDGFGWTAGDLIGCSSSVGVAGSSDLLDRPNRSAPPGKRATPPTGFFFLQEYM